MNVFISPLLINFGKIIIPVSLFRTAETIAEQVRSLTNDYRVGFGSFSDKPVAPFSAEVSWYERE